MLSIGLLAVTEVWVTSSRRQQLDELDWIGSQFKNAIGQYYEATPGVIVKTYPPSLHDLLLDKRYITVRRYLREIYRNPLTGTTAWTPVVAPDGGVRGALALTGIDPPLLTGIDPAVISSMDLDAA